MPRGDRVFAARGARMRWLFCFFDVLNFLWFSTFFNLLVINVGQHFFFDLFNPLRRINSFIPELSLIFDRFISMFSKFK